MNKLNVKTNDTVLVIAGKDKGKKGKIMKAMPEQERVVVQGVNIVTRHTKPRKQGDEGGRIQKEAAIHVSNVMLVCPKCNNTTRVAHAEEGGKKVRLCKQCNKARD